MKCKEHRTKHSKPKQHKHRDKWTWGNKGGNKNKGKIVGDKRKYKGQNNN